MNGNNPDVLIVGAGPVGIVLACELLQQGVSIRIIDSLQVIDESDPHSKGILIWPRSLELLRRIGVSEQMAATGHHSPGVGYFSSGRLLGTAWLDRHPDTPYNYVLTLPQRETEKVLRARFAELGGIVERGVTLEALDNDGPLPVAGLRHPDGTLETVQPSWLVGADGPGSATRTLLGLRFDGEPIDVSYAIGDAVITGEAPTNAGYYYSPDGVVALVPIGAGVYRIAANIPHDVGARGNPPRELLEEIIRRRAKIDIMVHEPLWTRTFRPRLGITERFRAGRCFLAGDSAHAISPAGGQGMNVGFQDAANLGWKLGGVVTGRLDESALDSYEPERLTGALRMSATSAAQAKFAMQRKPLRILRRDAVFLAARLAGVLQRVLVPLLSQTDSIYGDPDSRPVILRGRGLSPVGARLPLFAPPALPDGTPALDPYRHTVALWPGRNVPARWAARVRSAQEQIGERTYVLDLAGLPAGPAAKLRRHLGTSPVIAVVRPDGHLAHLAATDADVLAFLDAAAPARHAEDGRQVPVSAR